MADTAHLDELTEYRDDEATLDAKVAALADMVRASQHTVAFTGAGISTSADIPDFRGPNGVWTCQAQNRECPEGVEMTQAMPTFCHMTLVEMLKRGDLSFVISQNVDGLHRRSGVVSEALAELHGNLYLEVCWAKGCGKEYMRTFDVSARVNGTDCAECRRRVPHFCHCTGRECECGAALKDSIIHFKENLPMQALEAGFDHAEKSELMIVLGSSLRVSPACEMPKVAKQRGAKLVVVNLQATPLDDKSDLRINGETDTVMRKLAAALGIEVGEFDLSDFFNECSGEASIRHKEAPTVEAALFDTGLWYAVDPAADCEHMGRMGGCDLQADVRAPCAACGNVGENMLCLECGLVHCGRHVKGHAVAHAEDSGHAITAGFADLSFWCHRCDQYLKHSNPALAPVYAALHMSKFDEPPPGCALCK